MRRLTEAWKDDLDPFVHWLFDGGGRYRPEQGLWAAVLQRAVMDYDLWERGRRNDVTRYRPTTNLASRAHYMSAKRWIWGYAQNDRAVPFEAVCDYLGLEVSVVRQMLLRGLPDSVYQHYRSGSASTRITARSKPPKIQARAKRERRARRAA